MMRKLMLAGFFLSISPAFAQQPVPQEFQLKLTLQEIQLIGTALVDRPYKDVANLLSKLNTQVTAQQQPTPPPEPQK